MTQMEDVVEFLEGKYTATYSSWWLWYCHGWLATSKALPPMFTIRSKL